METVGTIPVAAHLYYKKASNGNVEMFSTLLYSEKGENLVLGCNYCGRFEKFTDWTMTAVNPEMEEFAIDHRHDFDMEPLGLPGW